MKIIAKSLVAAVIIVAGSMSASAADLSGPQRGGQCIGDYRSEILDTKGTVEGVNLAVTERYEEALDVSERKSTVFNQGHLYTWSNEAKVSCAKAIGYLKSNEINDEQVSQCDCYYIRMRMIMRGRW